MSDITHHIDYRQALAAIKQRISPHFEIVPQPVGQLPWGGHVRTLLAKVKP